jgi:hypothetical protein
MKETTRVHERISALQIGLRPTRDLFHEAHDQSPNFDHKFVPLIRRHNRSVIWKR